MPANDLKLVAKWTANTNTPYHVMHYLQNYAETGYDLGKDEPLFGTTDTNTAAATGDFP